MTFADVNIPPVSDLFNQHKLVVKSGDDYFFRNDLIGFGLQSYRSVRGEHHDRKGEFGRNELVSVTDKTQSRWASPLWL